MVQNMRVLRIKAVENLLERLEDKIMKNNETDKKGKRLKIEASVFSLQLLSSDFC